MRATVGCKGRCKATEEAVECVEGFTGLEEEGDAQEASQRQACCEIEG